MNIVCLDMEGVLVPEIWIAFAEASGIPELRRTTRDEPDYDKLMTWRLGILKEHGLGLKEIQATIARIDPLPGAKAFLDELRSVTQVIILSDTFEEFAKPLMEKLGWPTIFCNSLEVAPDGEITGFKMRCEKSKLTTVKALQSIGYDTIASGDSLQRSWHDPGQQGRLPVQEHGADQGRPSGDPGLRGVSAIFWRPSRRHCKHFSQERGQAMNEKFRNLGFYPADILLPEGADMTKWAVVACDQFTSQPEYWQAVEDTVGDAPSTLRLILPEAKLNDPDVDGHIAAINGAMKAYLDQGMFKTLPDSLFYIERTQSDGKVRHGLIGMVDLDQYDFTPGSGALIRATEGTVLSRIRLGCGSGRTPPSSCPM